MDDGIKKLGLHLSVTCRELSAAHLIAFILGLPIATYTDSFIFTRYVLDMISDPIEVKVGCLSENVFAGCTVTESKCSWMT